MRRLIPLLATLVLLLTPGLARAAQPIPWPTGAFDLPGVNDWTCRPSARHPEPAVVVHGTFGDRQHLLERLETTLVGQGYCVFALDYGNRATGPIQDSAKQLRAFVARVLAATHARKVEMVGHSQGGMMPRYYINFLGGARYVDDLVGLAPSNHGTQLVNGLNTSAGSFCEACLQQEYESPFIRHLNAGDETPGGVSYTNIISRYDEVVTPYTSAFLRGPSSQVTNVTLQRYCPLDLSEHVRIPSDGTAIAIVLDAFSHPGPARASKAYGCQP